MKDDPNEHSQPIDLEDDQELWRVLGRAKKPEAGPYFVRRVLREAASLPQTRPVPIFLRGLQAWWQAGLPLLRPPRAAVWPGAFAAAAICVAGVLTTFSPDNLGVYPGAGSRRSANGPAAVATTQNSALLADNTAGDDKFTPQDAEVIADLDSLMAHEETHLWTDDTATF